MVKRGGEDIGVQDNPASYTPRHLAEKILTSRAALEGERKQVTVPFCDIADSTALAERLGPEAMHELLNRFFELALHEVHRHEGTINQFLGDGFMALFGAPLACEDHAERAVLAAAEIRRRLAADGTGLGAGVAVTVRMGPHTGPVVVGKIGDNLRMDYTAVGDTTHLAARLQHLADPGAILLSESTRGLVDAYVDAAFLGERELKGLGPQRVYRVERVKPSTRRFDVALRRGLSPLVGRRHELAVLERVYREAQAGALRVVDLVGEAGIGKSRLLYEFRQQMAGEPAFFLEGHCASFGRTIPFLPFVDVVRNGFRIDERDTPAEIARKLGRGLELLGVGAEGALPFLLNLLGLDPGGDAFRGLDGEIIGARTREVLEDLVRARCRLSPVVLALDDLHWIDTASEELLLRLIRTAGVIPLLGVCVFRPEYRPPWAGRADVAELTLGPLSEESCLLLAQNRLGAEALPEDLARLIVDRAEGNPLFAEELACYVVESGAFTVAKDGVRSRAESATLLVPGSLQDLVMARVDRLPEGARAVLQVASIIGRRFSRDLLQTASGADGHLADDVRALEAQELIFRHGGDEREEYVFKHVLIQEAVYASLLTTRRATLHAQVAEAIEQSYGDRLGEWAELLAHHWTQTERVDKAVRYLAMAGEKSLRVYSVEEAHERFRRVVELVEAHPGCADDRFLADVLLAWCRAHYYRADFRGLIALERYLPRVEALGDRRRLSLVLFWLGFANLLALHWDKARPLLERAQALGEALGDDECVGYACMGLAFLHVPQPGGTVTELASRGLEIAGRLGDVYLVSKCLVVLLYNCAFAGSHQRARDVVLRALDLARRAGDARAIAVALTYLASVDIAEERFDEAVENAEEGLRISLAPLDRAGLRILKGVALALMGQGAEGVSMARQGIEDLRAADAGAFSAFFDVPFGAALVVSGQMAAGVRWIEDAIRRTTDIGSTAGPAAGHMVLGEIYFEMVRAEKKTPLPVLLKNATFILKTPPFARRLARRHLEESARRAREADLPGVLARSLFDLGVLSTASRRFDEARRYLQEAQALAEPHSAVLTEKIRHAVPSLPVAQPGTR